MQADCKYTKHSFITFSRSKTYTAVQLQGAILLLHWNDNGGRIRSDPGKSVCPVSSSAMMQPTDQISTIIFKEEKNAAEYILKNDICQSDLTSTFFHGYLHVVFSAQVGFNNIRLFNNY